MKNKIIIVFLNACVLFGCAVEPDLNSAALPDQNLHAQLENETAKATMVEDLAPQEVTIEPTEDNRLTPENWQDWPIIPEVTESAREIYQKGIAMGNNPKAFSKVGDCQNVKQSFLGFFDHPGKYEELTGYRGAGRHDREFPGLF